MTMYEGLQTDPVVTHASSRSDVDPSASEEPAQDLACVFSSSSSSPNLDICVFVLI